MIKHKDHFHGSDLEKIEEIYGIRKEDIPGMARHAAKEANPLYPVPRLMDPEELERFYEKVADWSAEHEHRSAAGVSA